MRAITVIVTLAFGVLLLAAGPVVADVYEWANPSDGYFTDAGNWLWGGLTPANPPASEDIAVFDVTGPSPFTVRVDAPTANRQAIINTSELLWDLAGNTYSLTADFVTHSGDSLYVGESPTDYANLAVSNGTLEAYGWVSIGMQSDSGNLATGSLRITGGDTCPTQFILGHDAVWDSSLQIGAAGQGMLNIDGYASVTVKDHAINAEGTRSSGWVLMGVEAGSQGIINVTGPNASFTVEHAPVIVGNNGQGGIYITEGATMAMGDGELWVGSSETASGNVVVFGSGSRLVENSGYASIIGDRGTGSLMVSSDGYASFAHLLIGDADYRGSETDPNDGNIHLGIGSLVIEGSSSGRTAHAGPVPMMGVAGTIVESLDAQVGVARDAVTDPNNPVYSQGYAEVRGTDYDPATWNVRTSLALGGSMDRSGGQGELHVFGPNSFVSAGAPIEESGTVRIWENGWLEVADGRVVIGDSAYDEPGTVRIGERGWLDLAGGRITCSATLPDSGDITVGRVDVGGRLSGYGTIEGDLHVAGGYVENSSGQTLLVTLQVLIGTNDMEGLMSIRSGSQVSASVLHVFPRGTVDLDDGTLSGNVTVEGLLQGSGHIYGSVTMTPTGTLSPGHSTGMLNLMGSLNLDGRTVMDIDGVDYGQYDSIFGMGSVEYGGELELHFTGLYNFGDSLRLFGFIGYNLETEFSDIQVDGLGPDQVAAFNYASGSVMVAPRPTGAGDFTGDRVVNQADYTTWADHYGWAVADVQALNMGWFREGSYAETTGDLVNQGHYTTWADHYGAHYDSGGNQIPEPATLALLTAGGLAILRHRSGHARRA